MVGSNPAKALLAATDEMCVQAARAAGQVFHDYRSKVDGLFDAAGNHTSNDGILGRMVSLPERTDPDRIPRDRLVFTKDRYIEALERKIGRPLNKEEMRILDQGCTGVVQHYLAQRAGVPVSDISLPDAMKLSFGDAESCDVIARAEELLAPGEIAEREFKRFQNALIRGGELKSAHGPRWFAVGKPIDRETPGVARNAYDYYEELMDDFNKARRELEQAAIDIPPERRRELMNEREAAKIAGAQRTFAGVSRIWDILATQPADVGEFRRLVKSDPFLGRSPDVDDWDLPSRHPSTWKVDIVARHFYSGPGDNSLPDATRLRPDPVTNRIDMSEYSEKTRKPGHVNFDYAVYDQRTGLWLHANHGETNDPAHPMRVFQTPPSILFAGKPDWDRLAIFPFFS